MLDREAMAANNVRLNGVLVRAPNTGQLSLTNNTSLLSKGLVAANSRRANHHLPSAANS